MDTEQLAVAAAARATAVPPAGVTLPLDPVVLEGKKKFNLAMEDELLNYKHNHAMHIEACANTLLKIFNNVLDHPDETKYRQVKATGNTFKNTVCNVKGGEHLMTLSGWRTQVLDLQKLYVFDGEQGGHKWQILEAAAGCLTRALATIHEKAERKRHEAEEKAAAEKARREQVLLALEDDKIDRRVRMETVGVVAVADALAGGSGAGAGGAGLRSPAKPGAKPPSGGGAGSMEVTGTGLGSTSAR